MENCKRIYLALFQTLDKSDQFIKIGISSFPLERRFSIDLVRYQILQLAESEYYSVSDARIVEDNIHKILHKYQIRPNMPLRAFGNTECFSMAALDEAIMILSGKLKQYPRPEKKWVKNMGPGRRKRRGDVIGFRLNDSLTKAVLEKERKTIGYIYPSSYYRTSRYTPDVGVMFKNEVNRIKGLQDDLEQMRYPRFKRHSTTPPEVIKK